MERASMENLGAYLIFLFVISGLNYIVWFREDLFTRILEFNAKIYWWYKPFAEWEVSKANRWWYRITMTLMLAALVFAGVAALIRLLLD